jgi:hypothetical protein
MSSPAENAQSNDTQTNKPSEVMVVDHWLIFNCPHCEQTIKLDRKDGVNDIECPSCHSVFEPLLDRDVVIPPSRKTPSRKRARRRGPRQAGEDDEAGPSTRPRTRSRPTTSSLPSEGLVKLSLTPTSQSPEDSNSKTSVLPVRSALELERRRVESLDTTALQPDETELDAVIEEQSGGNYKRIRVRTRKKRLTEKQRAFNLYLLGGLASVAIIGLSLWGASKMFRDSTDQGDSNPEPHSGDAFADSEPIGNTIGNRNALINEFITATTVDQLLKLVRYPKRLEPTIRAFYGSNDLPELSVKSVNPVTGIQSSLPKNFSRYQMITGSDSVALYIEKTDTHGYRADWESLVGLSSMPWADFISSKATRTARMRVYLTDPDNSYYEAPFDKARYRSLRIEDPSRKHTLYGYFERNNTDLRRLTDKFLGMEKKNQLHTSDREFEISVIVDIRYPAGAANPAQVEIIEYVTDSWLRP